MEDIQMQLINEASTIYSILNQYSIDEIYSYLEASIDHPQRMQVVMHGFLARDQTNRELNNNRNSETNNNITTNKISKTLLDNLGSIPSENSEVQPPSSESTENENQEVVSGHGSKYVRIGEQHAGIKQLVENDEKINGDLTTLQEMFPKKDKKNLHQMYKEVFLIEGEKTLDYLILHCLEHPDVEIHTPVFPTTSQTYAENFSHNIDQIPGNFATKEDNNLLEAGQIDSINAIGSDTAIQTSLFLSAGPSSEAGPSMPENSIENRYTTETQHSNGADTLSKTMLDQLVFLLSVLPDADSSFLKLKCLEWKESEEEMKAFLTEALEKKHEYPILNENQISSGQNFEISSIEEFLEIFPDPENYFKNEDLSADKEYYNHSLNYLKLYFPSLDLNVIELILTKSINLTNATALLTVEEERNKSACHGTENATKNLEVFDPSSLLERPHIHFMHEIAYLQRKVEIDAYINEKNNLLKLQIFLAKERNELLECPCCCNDEVLNTNMSNCPEGHILCKDCIRRYALSEIGAGKTIIKCFQDNCATDFSLAVLQDILTRKQFSKIMEKRQIEEVTAANIEGLETCPFCEFSTIPAHGYNIFHCQNPECMKDSCRLCREPSHIPLRCNEIEKDEEVQARKFLEDRMTEALIRECWNCHKKFVKTSGCNKMICTCGAMMCYICRQPIKGYEHFKHGTCQLHMSDAELHDHPVMAEANRAKQELMERFPGLTLKNDPTK